jgi:phosphoserine phosphatase RsbU/P
MVVYKILVADTSEKTTASIKHIIRKYNLNYELTIFTEGREACKKACTLNPDIIIFAVGMTDIDGIRAVKILKRLPQTKNIPALLIASARDLKDAYASGADDFIYKPFNELELLFRIRFALKLSENNKQLTQQNQLQKKQAEEVKRQYKVMEDQRKDMIDDITYSRRIQNAIMPSKEHISILFSEYFLFNKPKRIVSGDFYWISFKDNRTILAVADCTGHGISGAFLTIAGTAYLNEIINFCKPDPAEILNQLRLRIMRLLNQKGLEGEATDGMDISLCIFDFTEMKVQYAGANNATYVVRKNSELQILSADRMPIGIHEHYNRSFNNKELNVEKGDMIYLFSDGYADQFGGPEDQKFRYKRLQNLCVENHAKSMNEQYDAFERTMDEWIGYRDQVDDMLIIGIRI